MSGTKLQTDAVKKMVWIIWQLKYLKFSLGITKHVKISTMNNTFTLFGHLHTWPFKKQKNPQSTLDEWFSFQIITQTCKMFFIFFPFVRIKKVFLIVTLLIQWCIVKQTNLCARHLKQLYQGVFFNFFAFGLLLRDALDNYTGLQKKNSTAWDISDKFYGFF